jgi:hypothetical protein
MAYTGGRTHGTIYGHVRSPEINFPGIRDLASEWLIHVFIFAQKRIGIAYIYFYYKYINFIIS